MRKTVVFVTARYKSLGETYTLARLTIGNISRVSQVDRKIPYPAPALKPGCHSRNTMRLRIVLVGIAVSLVGTIGNIGRVSQVDGRSLIGRRP